MPTLTEGQLQFEFPEGWLVSKLDEWSFYRNQFSKLGHSQIVCKRCHCRFDAGNKGCDIAAIEQKVCLWLIEVKDYRVRRREKAINLPDEIAIKVRDSLAALAAARLRANEDAERKVAAAAVRCPQIRIALHLEQPAKTSKLFPRAIDLADVFQRLRQLIKSIDPHPLVIEMRSMNGVAWQVQGV